MQKIILLIGIIGILLIAGCDPEQDPEQEYPKCNAASQLSTGEFLVIAGYKFVIEYHDATFEDCCCNTLDSSVCICKTVKGK